MSYGQKLVKAGHFSAENLKFAKLTQNAAIWCSNESSQCPDDEGNFLFGIGLKMTELRRKTCCQNMVAIPDFERILDHILAKFQYFSTEPFNFEW